MTSAERHRREHRRTRRPPARGRAADGARPLSRSAPAAAAVSVFFSLSEQWRRVRSLWESAASAAEGLDDERLLLAVYQSADHGTGAPSQLDRRRQVASRLADLAARHHDANGSYIADYLAFTSALHDGTAAEIDEHLDRLERFDREVAHGEKVWTVTFSRAGRLHLAGCLAEAETLNDRALTPRHGHGPQLDLCGVLRNPHRHPEGAGPSCASCETMWMRSSRHSPACTRGAPSRRTSRPRSGTTTPRPRCSLTW